MLCKVKCQWRESSVYPRSRNSLHSAERKSILDGWTVSPIPHSLPPSLPPPPPPLLWPCRRCGPRLSAEAADKLKNRYVMMRTSARQHERATSRRTSIPITVRQLEAIVRIAESLAKMSLLPFALESHVDEALRLFRVSTLDAAMSGSLSG